MFVHLEPCLDCQCLMHKIDFNAEVLHFIGSIQVDWVYLFIYFDAKTMMYTSIKRMLIWEFLRGGMCKYVPNRDQRMFIGINCMSHTGKKCGCLWNVCIFYAKKLLITCRYT